MSLLDSHTPHRRKGFLGRRPAMHLGEDILLARHGSRIDRFAIDRRNHRTVAVLCDGTVDYAPNRLVAVPPTPLERLAQHVQDVRDDVAPVTKTDLKVLIWFTLGWIVVSALFIVGVIALSSVTGSQNFAQAASLYPAY
jgi:hypothetical protein